MPLSLKVLTPQRAVLDETVEQLVAQGELGQFGVLPLHAAYLTSLAPGVLSFRRGGREELLAVKGGYAEVKDDIVTVLADEAVWPADLTTAAARERLEHAARDLEERPFGHAEHEAARSELKWAEVLVALASRGAS